jgi:hypothetical protein
MLRFWPEELITTPEQFGQHWLSCAEGFCNRSHEVAGLLLRYEELADVAGLLLRYEALADPRNDVDQVEEYLGFPVDRGARKMVLGASPGGTVLPEDLDRLQQVVEPLASKLGYTRTRTS